MRPSRSVTVRLPADLHATLTAGGRPLSATLVDHLRYAAADEAIAWGCRFPMTPEEREYLRWRLANPRMRELLRESPPCTRYTDVIRLDAQARVAAANELDRR